jgi:murein DD-endopeptidase MepM/ murein hydrolase activator NlpD
MTVVTGICLIVAMYFGLGIAALFGLPILQTVETVYWLEGDYIPDAMREINRIMRDWRSGDVIRFDARAIDIMAARGRAVLAAADGRIEKIFWSEAGGRTLYERAPDGRTVYYYAHLDGYAPGLREGQVVRRGQRIATVGSTGNADTAAPHLHFAVNIMAPGDPWHGGRPINPYPLLVGQ